MANNSLLSKAVEGFNMTLFYKVGGWLFGFIAIGNIYSTIYSWAYLNLGSKVSSIAGILLNVLFITLFIYLYQSQPSSKEVNEAQGEMDKFLEELAKDEK